MKANYLKGDIEEAIVEIRKLAIFASILKTPDGFFRHMQGHITELSLVLNAFAIAEKSEVITGVLEQQLNSGWIPVSERLPNTSGKYRITVKYENFSGIYLMVSDARFTSRGWEIIGEQPVITNWTVTAWQQIVQEPYEEGSK